jgi:hypothetical protein
MEIKLEIVEATQGIDDSGSYKGGISESNEKMDSAPVRWLSPIPAT